MRTFRLTVLAFVLIIVSTIAYGVSMLLQIPYLQALCLTSAFGALGSVTNLYSMLYWRQRVMSGGDDGAERVN